MRKVEGCSGSGHPDRNDSTGKCEPKKQLYWSVFEISVLLKIVA
jgi:hypothetical protein